MSRDISQLKCTHFEFCRLSEEGYANLPYQSDNTNRKAFEPHLLGEKLIARTKETFTLAKGPSTKATANSVQRQYLDFQVAQGLISAEEIRNEKLPLIHELVGCKRPGTNINQSIRGTYKVAVPSGRSVISQKMGSGTAIAESNSMTQGSGGARNASKNASTTNINHCSRKNC